MYLITLYYNGYEKLKLYVLERPPFRDNIIKQIPLI